MDFKDLQKVWDRQKNEPMYIIDQAALYRQVKRRGKQAERIANINEYGLIVIAVLTSIILLIIGEGHPYSFAGPVAMLGTAGYIWWQRKRRLRRLGDVPVTIMDELTQALTNADYLVRFARTFAYWFLLPIGTVTVVRMLLRDVEPWRWAMILGSFVLSFLLVRWELRYRHLPRRRALEELRDALTQEVERP